MNKDTTYRSSSGDLQELAKRLKAGDVEAIELIYRTYFHRLLYCGVQITGPGYIHQVEDVIQEFFIWLAENGAKIENIYNLESYIFQSIRRNLQSILSSEKKSHAAYERYVQRTSPLRESEIRSPEQLHIQQEELDATKAQIQQELELLPPYLKEALYLRYFEDKPYPEIAAILSISDQVAYNYVFRAIKRLKQQMGDLKILLLTLYGIVKMLF